MNRKELKKILEGLGSQHFTENQITKLIVGEPNEKDYDPSAFQEKPAYYKVNKGSLSCVTAYYKNTKAVMFIDGAENVIKGDDPMKAVFTFLELCDIARQKREALESA